MVIVNTDRRRCPPPMASATPLCTNGTNRGLNFALSAPGLHLTLLSTRSLVFGARATRGSNAKCHQAPRPRLSTEAFDAGISPLEILAITKIDSGEEVMLVAIDPDGGYRRNGSE